MIKQFRDKFIFYLKYSHNWLFDSGTRAMEVLNAFGLVGFSGVFFLNNPVLIKLPTYENFALVTPPSYWLITLVLGVSCLLALKQKSLRSNQISGYLIMLSAVVWAIIALGFTMEDFNGITTAPLTYGLLSLFCVLTGTRLLLVNREEEEKQKKLVGE